MKVCTDACLFGAIIQASPFIHILDIGTGTGLISLMLAQRYDSQIDAVEIEEAAFEQAKENFENSLWKNRLHVFQNSIQKFAKSHNSKYDLIVCNPPFFQKSLKRETLSENIALHSDLLSFEELAEAVLNLLKPTGSFWVLLPPYESEVFEKLISGKNMFPQEKYSVFATENKKYIREIIKYSFEKTIKANEQKINIKTDSGEYTEDFKSLLKDYYLAF